jgi:hypothetical protein
MKASMMPAESMPEAKPETEVEAPVALDTGMGTAVRPFG